MNIASIRITLAEINNEKHYVTEKKKKKKKQQKNKQENLAPIGFALSV